MKNIIIDFQLIGKNYANDNRRFFEVDGMTKEEFAQAALDNYNSNAEAFGDEKAAIVPKSQEGNFKFGASETF